MPRLVCYVLLTILTVACNTSPADPVRSSVSEAIAEISVQGARASCTEVPVFIYPDLP